MNAIPLLLPLAMIGLLMFSQRKRAQQAQALSSSLAVGDRVMTTSGIYGVLVAVGPDVVAVRVSSSTVLHLARGAVARRIEPGDARVPSAAELVGEAGELGA